MCNKNHCMRKKRSNTARSKNGNNFIGKVKTGFQFKIKIGLVLLCFTELNLVLMVVQTSKDGKLPFHLTFPRRMTFSNA